jgi:hypothetical protein
MPRKRRKSEHCVVLKIFGHFSLPPRFPVLWSLNAAVLALAGAAVRCLHHGSTHAHSLSTHEHSTQKPSPAASRARPSGRQFADRPRPFARSTVRLKFQATGRMSHTMCHLCLAHLELEPVRGAKDHPPARLAQLHRRGARSGPSRTLFSWAASMPASSSVKLAVVVRQPLSTRK